MGNVEITTSDESELPVFGIADSDDGGLFRIHAIRGEVYFLTLPESIRDVYIINVEVQFGFDVFTKLITVFVGKCNSSSCWNHFFLFSARCRLYSNVKHNRSKFRLKPND